MKLTNDNRAVLTLDAGGTNFSFSALKGGKIIGKEMIMPSNGHDLNLCVNTIETGFKEIIKNIDEKPVAISFAFPGPGDYSLGVIGPLQNLPGFSDPIPLKNILETIFQIPVTISNDGDLFALGESVAGILPQINHNLSVRKSNRRYKNLVGLTLGTGLGGGVIMNNSLLQGDNTLPAEVWLLSLRGESDNNIEEHVSARAIVNSYETYATKSTPTRLQPYDIYEIALGKKEGDQDAAKQAYRNFGVALGDVVANLITIFDSCVVLGGGLSGASKLYMPSVMEELNSKFSISQQKGIDRLVQTVYNLDDNAQYDSFLETRSAPVRYGNVDFGLEYDSVPRLGIATSKIGASRAISLGAYALALKSLK